VLIAIVALPGLFMAVLLPTLTKKFDRFRIFHFCAIGNGLLGVISYFAGYQNMIVFYALIILHGICMGSLMVIQKPTSGLRQSLTPQNRHIYGALRLSKNPL